jgi:hypothetical protein
MNGQVFFNAGGSDIDLCTGEKSNEKEMFCIGIILSVGVRRNEEA